MKKFVLLIFFLSGLAQADEQTNNTTSQTQQPTQDISIEHEKALVTAAMMLADQEELHKEFIKMQADLPKTLDLAKQYRACLQAADDKNQAVDCQKDAQGKARALDLEDDELDENLTKDLKNWTPAEKTQYIKELDESIAFMEEVMPCMQAAKDPIALFDCSNKPAEDK